MSYTSMQKHDPVLADAKKRRRNEVLQLISGMSTDQWATESLIISRIVEHLELWHEARTILGFLSMDNEIDISSLLESGIKAGKQVGVPRISGKVINFHRIGSLDESWELHPYGVREPAAGLPTIDASSEHHQPVLIVTPGIAFDTDRNRLGHGGGFYDKFFARIVTRATRNSASNVTEPARESIGQITGNRVTSVAVCAKLQMTRQVPFGPFDMPVDIVVSGDGNIITATS